MTTIALPSIQSLLIEMFFEGQRLSTGTAFVCESSKGPVLVTNWHNVTGLNPHTKRPLSPTAGIPDRIVILHNTSGSLGQWHQTTELLYQDGKPRWFEHPVLGDRADFVALPLAILEGVQLYPYITTDGPAIVMQPATPISVIGFPFGLQAGGSLAVWATGFVASEPQVDFNDLPVFLIDCRTRPGQSGSAVITYGTGTHTLEDGSSVMHVGGPITKFRGIYSGRINDQSDIGIVWKAPAIQELLDSI